MAVHHGGKVGKAGKTYPGPAGRSCPVSADAQRLPPHLSGKLHDQNQYGKICDPVPGTAVNGEGKENRT